MNRPLAFVACLVAATFAAATRAQIVVDPNLAVQTWARGFSRPTGMAFIGGGDALVIEKDTGKVKLLDYRTPGRTVLDLPVANASEEGLLGIALSPSFATDRLVYLYYTAALADGGSAINNSIKR